MYTTLIKNNASEIQCLVCIIQCLVCIIFLFYQTLLFCPFDLSPSIRPPFPIFFVDEFYKNGEQVWRYRQLCFFAYWPESASRELVKWSPLTPLFVCVRWKKSRTKKRFSCRIFECSFFLVVSMDCPCSVVGALFRVITFILARARCTLLFTYEAQNTIIFSHLLYEKIFDTAEVKNYAYKYGCDYDAYYIY